MRCFKRKILPSILACCVLLFCMVYSVSGRIYYVTSSYQYFPIRRGQVYVNFDDAICPLTFTTFYADSNQRFHLNDTWFKSTLDATITAFYSGGWFNYTVSGTGTQQIHNGTKPSKVYFDGVEQIEGDTWSYSGGTVTVNTISTGVSLLWGNGELPLYGEYSVSESSNALVYGTNFAVYFPQGDSLGFQSWQKSVVLTMTSGNLNSTETYVKVHDGSGLFQFKANESFKMKVDYEVTNVKVEGDKGNEFRVIKSGSILSIDANDVVYIQWEYHMQPALPLMFIIGMVGLACISGGSLYAVQLLKKKEYYEGFRNGAIFVCLGIALVLAWLWS